MEKTKMNHQGYRVFRKVLDEEEGELAYRLWLDWYTVNGVGAHPVPSHGVISNWGVGHTAAAWYIRTRPGVLQVFRDIWGVDDLVVSFDGAGYLPPGFQRRDQSKGWLHVDQGGANVFKCVQGFVALTTNETATIGVVPYSQHSFSENVLGKKGNYIPLPHLDPSMAIRVPVQKGDMVVWDSRLVHMNYYGNGEERLVQYVSYLPRSGATQKQLEKRVQNWCNKRTTSHWAYPQRVSGLQPNNRGGGGYKIDYSTLVEPGSWVFQEFGDLINALI